MFLILLQPDLKSVIVLPPMVFSMLYVSKLSTRFFAGAIGAFLLVVGLVAWDSLATSTSWSPIIWTSTDRKNSYESLVVSAQGLSAQPHPDLCRAGRDRPHRRRWNQRQSLISVGSGGVDRQGMDEGHAGPAGLPAPAVAHNDFIFSVIAEEKGFLGSLTVLSLFGLVMFNGIRIAGLAGTASAPFSPSA
jgi:rod shape determining protein RodA